MKKSDGFSLVELSIVLVVIGLLTVPLITFIDLYMKERARRTTQENLVAISISLGQYFDKFGHYPCPARLNAGPSDLDYGDETVCTPHKEGKDRIIVNTHSASSDGEGCPDGVCTSHGLNGHKIKMGAVPYKALGIPREKVLDGYRNKITYAVTERYATPLRGQHLGAISIENSAGETAIEPKGSAQFILVSHGQDGKGSYSSSGVLNGTRCRSEKAADNENCDLDDVFLDGQYSEAQGAHYFDDMVMYKMYGNSLLWQASPFDQRNIYNATLGNVGIGTRAPSAKLDVAGDARVLGSFNTQKICNNVGEDCFSPEIIGGTGIRCIKKNEAMIGIAESKPVCEKVEVSNLETQKCPSMYFAIGFSLEGNLICKRPDWVATEENTKEITLD